MISVQDLRQTHLEFMQSKGYSQINRTSLVSPIYPRMFTPSAGIPYIEDYLAGNEASNRVACVQPCFRLDYIRVGDGRHLSLFEMGMTASCDGISHEEAIADSYTFLKDRGLRPSQIIVTYFGGGQVNGEIFDEDIKSRNLLEKLGIPKYNLIKTDIKEGFEILPSQRYAGPRLEFFYIQGQSMIEIWTSLAYTHRVVTDERHATKALTPLGHTAFAIGFGIERFCQALNAFPTIYEIDTIKPIAMIFYDSRKYATDPIIIADHLRGLALLVNDGVLEITGNSNRSRKSVIRRYLRNLSRHLEAMGLDKTADSTWQKVRTALEQVVEKHKSYYTELDGKASMITTNIRKALACSSD